KLFQYHARDEGWNGTIYEINFAAKNTPELSNYPDWMKATEQDKAVNFDWNWRNLDSGVERGYRVVDELLNFRSSMHHYLRACKKQPKDPDLHKELEGALEFAKRLGREDYALGQVARAVTFSRGDKLKKAREAIVCLAEKTKMPWRNRRKRDSGLDPA